jgi:hypothetical protein
VFKHITASNNLKSFRVRTAYADTGIINGQETTTSLGRDEADNNETNQTKNETTALETEGEEMKGENKIFSDKSYIPKDRMFAVVI